MKISRLVKRSSTIVNACNIKQLRQTTGAPIMKCKEALEISSDIQSAQAFLRSQNHTLACKLCCKEAREGVVGVLKTQEGFVTIELNCETDFVARSSEFRGAAHQVLEGLSASFANKTEEEIQAETAKALTGTLQYKNIDLFQLSGQFREKVSVGQIISRRATPNTIFGLYVHNEMEPLIGSGFSCVVLHSEAYSEELQTLANELAVHVFCHSPTFISREKMGQNEIDAITATIKRIFEPEIKNKNPAILDQIIEGKLCKNLSESVLLEQTAEFVENQSSIGELLRFYSKKYEKEITVDEFLIKKIK